MIEIWYSSPLAVVAALVNGLGQSAFFAMTAVYGVLQGLSLAQTSLLLALPPLAVIVSQYPIGLLSDRYDRRTLLTVLAFAAATIAALIIVLGGVSAVCSPSCSPPSAPLPCRSIRWPWPTPTTISTPTRWSGLRASSCCSMASAPSPGRSSSGWPCSALGPPGFLLYMMAVYGGLGLFAVYRMSRRAPPVQTEGAAMPAMAPTTTPVGATVMIAGGDLTPSPTMKTANMVNRMLTLPGHSPPS
jgi:MFS family permease